MTRKLTGKEIFLESLQAHGVEYIFGNPGTTELPLLNSLKDYPDIRYILTLFEGVAVGAAHYHAQASGRTAVANLHVGPGLANGLGMLYNAHRGRTPLLLTAGQQDTRMRLRGPLLGHDMVSLAAPLTKWSVQAESASELPLILHRAFKTAREEPPGPVFVSLPINVMEEESDSPPIPPARLFARNKPGPEGIAAAAELLAGAHRPAIICGDGVARAGAQEELVALAELIGAPVWNEGMFHHINFPLTHPNCRDRLPDDHAGIRRYLEGCDRILLIGGNFFEEFWYAPGSPFPPGCSLIQIEAAPASLAVNFSLDVGLAADPRLALEALLEALEEKIDGEFRRAAAERNGELAARQAREQESQQAETRRSWDNSPIAPARLMAELNTLLPPDGVIVNEAITTSPLLKHTLPLDRPGWYYGTRGGGIGQALPGALGVKLAHPERPVIALSGDGSALYTIQALWSAAHHNLPIVYIILNNRSYRILRVNTPVYRKKFGLKGEEELPHLELAPPELDYARLAQGFGVEGRRIIDPNDFAPALKAALESGRPTLLDVLTDREPE